MKFKWCPLAVSPKTRLWRHFGHPEKLFRAAVDKIGVDAGRVGGREGIHGERPVGEIGGTI